MKNNGFTLVELLAVIVVLGIILVIAIPNILGIIEKTRNDSFANTAKMTLSAAKKKLLTNPEYAPVIPDRARVIPLSDLDLDNISKDVDGGSYDIANSYVLVRNNNGRYEYYVTLVGSKRAVNFNNESNITVSDKSSLTPVPAAGSSPITGVLVEDANTVFLSNLVLKSTPTKPVTITPVFGAGTFAYTATVTSTVSTVLINATMEKPNDANLYVNGTLTNNSTDSASITLIIGVNIINVDVTSKATNKTIRYVMTINKTS